MQKTIKVYVPSLSVRKDRSTVFDFAGTSEVLCDYVKFLWFLPH